MGNFITGVVTFQLKVPVLLETTESYLTLNDNIVRLNTDDKEELALISSLVLDALIDNTDPVQLLHTIINSALKRNVGIFSILSPQAVALIQLDDPINEINDLSHMATLFGGVDSDGNIEIDTDEFGVNTDDTTENGILVGTGELFDFINGLSFDGEDIE